MKKQVCLTILFVLSIIFNQNIFSNNPLGTEFKSEEIMHPRKTVKTGKSIPIFPIKRTEISESRKKFIEEVAISHEELMFESLYNNKFGFYSSGKVKFNKKNNPSFLTNPERLSPNFGAMIAYNAYAIYRSMIVSGDIKKDEDFYIFEMGAGRGTLAYDILSFIENAAKEEENYKYETEWQAFYNQVQYIIGEISPKLIKKQKEKNKKYINLEKMEVMMLDAREVEKNFKQDKIKGLILSNELLDAFPVAKVVKNENNEFKVIVAIATCKKEYIEKFQEKYQSEGEKTVQKEQIIKNLMDGDSYIRKCFSEEIPEEANSEDIIIISKKSYIFLKELAEDKKVPIDKFITFYEIEVDIAYFPELYGYLERHGDYMSKKGYTLYNYPETWKEANIFYINSGIEDFIKSVSKILDVGFVLTIDYGFSAPLLFKDSFNKLRFFPKELVSNIYDLPGGVDITTDVDFTELAMNKNFDTVFYGPEISLFGNKLIIGEEKIMEPFDIDTDAPVSSELSKLPSEFLKSSSYTSNFKVLIQKTKTTKSDFAILADQKPLFYEEFNEKFGASEIKKLIDKNDESEIENIINRPEGHCHLIYMSSKFKTKEENPILYAFAKGKTKIADIMLNKLPFNMRNDLREIHNIKKV